MSCQAKEIVKMKSLAFALGQEESLQLSQWLVVCFFVFFFTEEQILSENSCPALTFVDTMHSSFRVGTSVKR